MLDMFDMLDMLDTFDMLKMLDIFYAMPAVVFYMIQIFRWSIAFAQCVLGILGFPGL